MTIEKKAFYMKLKMESELDTMQSLFISEDINTVNKWKYETRRNKEESLPEKEKSENSFRGVSIEFERTMESFQQSAPFLINTAPIMRIISDDKNFRGFAKKHGIVLETGEYELYQIGIEHITEINRRLNQSNSISQGIGILPGLFLLGLISAYDVFLSRLIRTILLTKPEILSSSERNLSFKDLVEIGSIEAARDRIIEKEIETVIRSSHTDQIEWIEKKLGLPLTKDLKIWPDFIEICERRNLITHTGGVVSSQYIAACKAHGVDVSARNVGDTLTVDQKYYSHAVSVILEMGIKLTQVIWRKLLPAEINFAAEELDEFSYRLITNRKYKAAAEMFEFGLYTMKKHGSEAIRKRMVVNYANAIKLGGDKPKAIRILEAEDWSASTGKYQISVAAVKDDVDLVISMMKRAVDSDEIKISNIRDWAVFENIRSDTKFVNAFEEVFGEKLLLDKETKSNLKPEGLDEDPTELTASVAEDTLSSEHADLSEKVIH